MVVCTRRSSGDSPPPDDADAVVESSELVVRVAATLVM